MIAGICLSSPAQQMAYSECKAGIVVKIDLLHSVVYEYNRLDTLRFTPELTKVVTMTTSDTYYAVFCSLQYLFTFWTKKEYRRRVTFLN